MSCPCKKCRDSRTGPFAMPHATIKITCRTCGDRSCPRADDCDLECAKKRVSVYEF